MTDQESTFNPLKKFKAKANTEEEMNERWRRRERENERHAVTLLRDKVERFDDQQPVVLLRVLGNLPKKNLIETTAGVLKQKLHDVQNLLSLDGTENEEHKIRELLGESDVSNVRVESPEIPKRFTFENEPFKETAQPILVTAQGPRKNMPGYVNWRGIWFHGDAEDISVESLPEEVKKEAETSDTFLAPDLIQANVPLEEISDGRYHVKIGDTPAILHVWSRSGSEPHDRIGFVTLENDKAASIDCYERYNSRFES